MWRSRLKRLRSQRACSGRRNKMANGDTLLAGLRVCETLPACMSRTSCLSAFVGGPGSSPEPAVSIQGRRSCCRGRANPRAAADQSGRQVNGARGRFPGLAPTRLVSASKSAGRRGPEEPGRGWGTSGETGPGGRVRPDSRIPPRISSALTKSTNRLATREAQSKLRGYRPIWLRGLADRSMHAGS